MGSPWNDWSRWAIGSIRFIGAVPSPIGLANYPAGPRPITSIVGRWLTPCAWEGESWHELKAPDPLIQQLRLLCRDEVALIEQRTALINQLQQALYEYYPTALAAFDDWCARLQPGPS